LLESALTYYQEFIEQRQQPKTQAELAATRDRVNRLLDDLAVLQGAGQVALLNDPAVLDDLRPTPEQRGQITELSRQMKKQREDAFRDFHRLKPEEREQRFLELARDNEVAVAEVLTAEQLGRLRQIVLQLQGPAAFRETHVAKALKLTADQKKRLRASEAEAFAFRPEWRHEGPGPKKPGGGPKRGDPRKEHEKARKAADDQVRVVLTAEQLKRWQEMTGDPFQGSP